MTHTRFCSPLRYPGGKGRLAPFLDQLLTKNGLAGGHYAEPYAGGAGAALSLLLKGSVNHVHINDLDRAIFAFWHSVVYETRPLCSRIRTATLNLTEWRKQRDIQENKANANLLDLGFSTFYLNRTNRSGILSGGVIGGVAQKGRWKLDARFNKQDLVVRIRKIAAKKNHISVYNLDAAEFLGDVAGRLPEQTLIYCDPPYVQKGHRGLYSNSYSIQDHKQIASCLISTPFPWVVSYDDTSEIRAMYRSKRNISYDLNYTMNERYRGREIMFFCDSLYLPGVSNPAYLHATGMRRKRITRAAGRPT